MIYTREKADLIAEQLRKFTGGYAHHIAGIYANIDFWLHEVREATKVIDNYNKRFCKLRDEQQLWVTAHGTEVYHYCPFCGGKCEFSNGTPSPPVRTSSSLLKEARKALIDAAYFFLIRCYHLNLLDNTTLKIHCESIGTSIEPSDLEN